MSIYAQDFTIATKKRATTLGDFNTADIHDLRTPIHSQNDGQMKGCQRKCQLARYTEGVLMHLKCIHELCTIIVIFHHICII